MDRDITWFATGMVILLILAAAVLAAFLQARAEREQDCAAIGGVYVQAREGVRLCLTKNAVLRTY